MSTGRAFKPFRRCVSESHQSDTEQLCFSLRFHQSVTMGALPPNPRDICSPVMAKIELRGGTGGDADGRAR